MNFQPDAYEAPALPLSYIGGVYEARVELARAGGAHQGLSLARLPVPPLVPGCPSGDSNSQPVTGPGPQPGACTSFATRTQAIQGARGEDRTRSGAVAPPGFEPGASAGFATRARGGEGGTRTHTGRATLHLFSGQAPCQFGHFPSGWGSPRRHGEHGDAVSRW